MNLTQYNTMPILRPCFEYLTNNASGAWHESYTMLDKATNNYKHPTRRDMVLLRVETGVSRAFYWIYNINDAVKFNEYVGLTLKWEAHEHIITSRCRLFYDIDLSLDEFEKHEFSDRYGYDLSDDNELEVMDEIGKSLAVVFKEATLISIEEHGNDLEGENLIGFDWIFAMRNRALEGGGFKISIHLITNLMLPLAACGAIVNHVKCEVIPNYVELLGINDDIVEKLVDSIDQIQYRLRGSLGLPHGTKKNSLGEYRNCIYRDYNIPN